MNHDVTHCLDYDPKKCPKDCYRAEVTRDAKRRYLELPDLLMSWEDLEGTRECPKEEE